MNAHPNFPVSKACSELPGVEDTCPLAELAAKASAIITRLDEIDDEERAASDAVTRSKLEREQVLLNAELEAVEASAVYLVPASSDGALFLLAQLNTQVNAMNDNAHCAGARKDRFHRAEILSQMIVHGLRRYLLAAGGAESRALDYYLDGDLDPRSQLLTHPE
jgi:hypothetical protein